jgi:hypothetical protein
VNLGLAATFWVPPLGDSNACLNQVSIVVGRESDRVTGTMSLCPSTSSSRSWRRVQLSMLASTRWNPSAPERGGTSERERGMERRRDGEVQLWTYGEMDRDV